MSKLERIHLRNDKIKISLQAVMVIMSLVNLLILLFKIK